MTIPGLRLTNRFHVAVRLFSNRSQMTSKCGKNKKVAHEAIAECVTDVLVLLLEFHLSTDVLVLLLEFHLFLSELFRARQVAHASSLPDFFAFLYKCLFVQVLFFPTKFDEVFSYPGRCAFPLLLIFRDAIVYCCKENVLPHCPIVIYVLTC